ncbi:MAG TPA: translation initiation factor IF-3, partial [Casimicrobiaceae bacterium]|nr:translation initiation factor IF-3 [Casimicrobiaceae bacterium]
MALDKQQQRLNGEINAPEIRLVGVDGEQLGIVPLAEAMAKAEAAELDLVEIAPMAKPPVCRIMDYGKFKYREAKKQHEAKLKL